MRFSLLLPLVLALGCAGIQTDYDYDPLVSFENMKSYRWKRSTAEQVMDPFVVKYIQASVRRELGARGFAYSEEDPDFLVTLRDEFEDRLEVDERSGAFRRTLDTRDLHKDDLILHIVDPRTDNVIWRGVASDVIDKRASSEERRERVDEGVQALLQKFPPPL
jgi:hypothetical protein